MDLEKSVRIAVLKNAVKFNGKANPKAVIGKIISENPDSRDNMKEIVKTIQEKTNEINSLSLEKQKEMLEELAPESLLKKKKEKIDRNIFEFLGIKEGEKVITAFPPEPSKYPHIGHAKASLLNYELARKYKGKFILRFEDTNPKLAKNEFYDIQLENYKWLGLKPDEIEYASDNMDRFIEFAEMLMKKGSAYVCDCSQETMKNNRFKGLECSCRKCSTEENKHRWDDMQNLSEGSMVLRLKIDISHKNSTMRDPTIMRIIDEEHPRLGKKYRLWPTYDFENSVMDGIENITHRLRSKEFEMRNELQRYIQTLLGFVPTKIYEFARFNLVGVESSGRIIREKIENKELIGWDDPTLTTLVALRRRGFLPEAIKRFVISTGITKSEATLTWDDLIIHNKRLLDAECNRYFFVNDPQKITIKGSPEQTINSKIHPDFPERGTRTFNTKEDFLITKEDYDSLEDGKLYRLMDCLNFIKRGDEFTFDSIDHLKYKESGEKIIHWLPDNGEQIKISILMPDKKVMKGTAEKSVEKIKEGDVIQFERFGFCRLDNKENNEFWYTHK